MQVFPALFLCDLNGNAEGIVYHFCDEGCRDEFKRDIEKSFAQLYRLRKGTSSGAVSQTHCDNCNADLAVPNAIDKRQAKGLRASRKTRV